MATRIYGASDDLVEIDVRGLRKGALFDRLSSRRSEWSDPMWHWLWRLWQHYFGYPEYWDTGTEAGPDQP